MTVINRALSSSLHMIIFFQHSAHTKNDILRGCNPWTCCTQDNEGQGMIQHLKFQYDRKFEIYFLNVKGIMQERASMWQSQVRELVTFTYPVLYFAVRISNDLAHAIRLHSTIMLYDLQLILRITTYYWLGMNGNKDNNFITRKATSNIISLLNTF